MTKDLTKTIAEAIYTHNPTGFVKSVSSTIPGVGSVGRWEPIAWEHAPKSREHEIALKQAAATLQVIRDSGYVIAPARNDSGDWPIIQSDLNAAIAEFQAKLPGWWFTIGSCSVSADTTIGPDRTGQDAHLLSKDFQEFMCDYSHPASIADALREVTTEALAAKEVRLSEIAAQEGK